MKAEIKGTLGAMFVITALGCLRKEAACDAPASFVPDNCLVMSYDRANEALIVEAECRYSALGHPLHSPWSVKVRVEMCDRTPLIVHFERMHIMPSEHKTP